ncbi:MAG: GntR family transcriptional regulator [Gammaproteobacteria bacterium]
MKQPTEDLLGKLQATSIDPNSPTPLYYQLYTMLHDAIAGGELESGSKMPSEKELASAFGVSRITARRALDELALKNMVARHRGRGTFVDYEYQSEPIHAPLSDLMESLDHMGRDTKVKVLDLQFITPTTRIAGVFEAEQDETLCHCTRVRSNKAVPFAFYVTWTRGFDSTLTRAKLESKPRMRYFEAYGVRISHVEQYLSAEGASVEVAESLGVGTGKPLLKLVRQSRDNAGRLLDHLTALYNPDLFRYKVETSLD